MPEYSSPIPPDYITTHKDALGSPVICTALLLLTLTKFSFCSSMVGV